MKIIYFLELIAALGLKVALSIQLNELMKLSEYQRSRSFSWLENADLPRILSKRLFRHLKIYKDRIRTAVALVIFVVENLLLQGVTLNPFYSGNR